jgi:hypothetical protein
LSSLTLPTHGRLTAPQNYIRRDLRGAIRQFLGCDLENPSDLRIASSY